MTRGGRRATAGAGALFVAAMGAQVLTQQKIETAAGQVIRIGETQRTSSDAVRVQIHRPGGAATELSVGRRTIYEYDLAALGRATITIVALVPESQKPWVGPEQDFYVDAGTKLVGVRVKRSGNVVWCDSLVDLEAGRNTPEAAIDAVEARVTIADVDAALRGGDTDAEREAWVTDLRPVFGRGAFTNGRYSSEMATRLQVSLRDVTNGQLHLHLENPASEFVGDVWIDVTTKRVVKALESGPASPRR